MYMCMCMRTQEEEIDTLRRQNTKLAADRAAAEKSAEVPPVPCVRVCYSVCVHVHVCLYAHLWSMLMMLEKHVHSAHRAAHAFGTHFTHSSVCVASIIALPALRAGAQEASRGPIRRVHSSAAREGELVASSK